MKPLALLLYERILPGSQLMSRLEDLGYRVQAIANAEDLVAVAEQQKPLVVIADFEPRAEEVREAVVALKARASTAHVPVIAVVSNHNAAAQTAARATAARLVVQDTAVLQHLPHFLDQALSLD